jgi:hypothetical protein
MLWRAKVNVLAGPGSLVPLFGHQLQEWDQWRSSALTPTAKS